MRKFTLVTTAFLFIASLANAQIKKGGTFIGGSLNFSSNKSKPTSTTNVETISSNWSISPQLGKVIKDNKVAGIFLNIGISLNKQTSDPSNLAQTKNSFYGGGIFLRNYFVIANRFYLFGEASLGATAGKSEGLADNGTTRYVYNHSKTIGSSVSLTPGVSFAASKKIHLEAAFSNLLFLSYGSTKTKEYSAPGVLFRETKSKNFTASANANGSNNLFLGIRFILP